MSTAPVHLRPVLLAAAIAATVALPAHACGLAEAFAAAQAYDANYDAARAEFWPLVLRVQDVLERAYAPHGMNMGLNLGRAGGAGVPSHYHFHVVPRWEGDTNFMTVVSGVRLVPEDPRSSWERLRAAFADEEGA